MVSTTRAKNLMNTKLTPGYNVSKCLSLKNFYSQKLSKLISAPSLSHHSNTHTTTRINISSLILYLLLSLLQNKSLLSHKQFAQNFCFCVTFPIQHSLEHQTGSLWAPCIGCSPGCSKHLTSSSRKGDSPGMAPGTAVCTRTGLFPGQRHNARVRSLPFPAVTGVKSRQGKVWVSTTVNQSPFTGTVKARQQLLLPLQSLQWDSWLLSKRLLNKIYT